MARVVASLPCSAACFTVSAAFLIPYFIFAVVVPIGVLLAVWVLPSVPPHSRCRLPCLVFSPLLTLLAVSA
jgi:hypothetical protein